MDAASPQVRLAPLHFLGLAHDRTSAEPATGDNLIVAVALSAEDEPVAALAEPGSKFFRLYDIGERARDHRLGVPEIGPPNCRHDCEDSEPNGNEDQHDCPSMAALQFTAQFFCSQRKYLRKLDIFLAVFCLNYSNKIQQRLLHAVYLINQ
jgi:hypothetical protein